MYAKSAGGGRRISKVFKDELGVVVTLSRVNVAATVYLYIYTIRGARGTIIIDAVFASKYPPSKSRYIRLTAQSYLYTTYTYLCIIIHAIYGINDTILILRYGNLQIKRQCINVYLQSLVFTFSNCVDNYKF